MSDYTRGTAERCASYAESISKGSERFIGGESYVEEVVKRLSPELIILFGSFSEGDISEGSDVDLLVVADFKEDFLDRIRTLMKLNRFGIPIEPLGYTPEEFEEMKGKSPFIEEILKKGKILFRRKE